MEEPTSKQNLEDQGMEVYQYIVDHFDSCSQEMPALIEKLRRVDTCGQFFASTARYLAAVDREHFEGWLPLLIECAIEKDRERRYIGSLLQAIWGDDYRQRVDELKATDDNFRRIYKRIYTDDNPM